MPPDDQGSVSDTPLSDLMATLDADDAPQSYQRFITAFRSSKLGVLAVGTPAGVVGDTIATNDQSISLGLTDHQDGQPKVLAFADPVAFARRFGQQFNADMLGDAIFKTVLQNDRCHGILVNSALSETSVIIDRETIVSLAVSLSEPARRRPWWRFW
jgi:hypothetical protein